MANEKIEILETNKWLTEKPNFNRECSFVTANKYERNNEPIEFSYSVWQIKALDGEDENGNPAWYWGLLNGDGEEWGDLDDLYANFYFIIEPPTVDKTTLTLK